MADYGALADRLDAVASDIDDIAFDELSQAVADGEVTRPDNDKQLMQARRAVEKASMLLRRLADDG